MILIIMGTILTIYKCVDFVKNKEKKEYSLIDKIDSFTIPISFILAGLFLFIFDIAIFIWLFIIVLVEKIIIFIIKKNWKNKG
ncbi:MAG TPA: hypothetical protein DCR28_00520 [Eubacterium sp.]|nr:hypothetical protein [Eubacterium sp.]